MKGEVISGGWYMLGPDKSGQFHEIKILGMQKDRTDIPKGVESDNIGVTFKEKVKDSIKNN